MRPVQNFQDIIQSHMRPVQNFQDIIQSHMRPDLVLIWDQVSYETLSFMQNQASSPIWDPTTQHNGFLAPPKKAPKAQCDQFKQQQIFFLIQKMLSFNSFSAFIAVNITSLNHYNYIFRRKDALPLDRNKQFVAEATRLYTYS